MNWTVSISSNPPFFQYIDCNRTLRCHPYKTTNQFQMRPPRIRGLEFFVHHVSESIWYRRWSQSSTSRLHWYSTDCSIATMLTHSGKESIYTTLAELPIPTTASFQSSDGQFTIIWHYARCIIEYHLQWYAFHFPKRIMSETWRGSSLKLLL